MKQTPLERKIADIIDPVIKDLGFDLIQVRMIGTQNLQTLQILAENPETGKMDLNGCTAVSRAISAVLDVEDPIASAYQLEVSSPGIDRPLMKIADFEKYTGFDVSVETEMPQDGQKRFRGKLVKCEADAIEIATEDGAVKIEFDNVLKAKLVMTEELVNGKPKGQKKSLNPKKNKTDNTNKKSKTLESEEV